MSSLCNQTLAEDDAREGLHVFDKNKESKSIENSALQTPHVMFNKYDFRAKW